MMIAGMKVITSPLLEPRAKLSLSDSCPCSKEVREEFNAWLLKEFGREPAKAVVLPTGEIVMAPSAAHQLKKEILDIHPMFRMVDRLVGGVFRGY